MVAIFPTCDENIQALSTQNCKKKWTKWSLVCLLCDVSFKKRLQNRPYVTPPCFMCKIWLSPRVAPPKTFRKVPKKLGDLQSFLSCHFCPDCTWLIAMILLCVILIKHAPKMQNKNILTRFLHLTPPPKCTKLKYIFVAFLFILGCLLPPFLRYVFVDPLGVHFVEKCGFAGRKKTTIFIMLSHGIIGLKTGNHLENEPERGIFFKKIQIKK